MELKSHQTRLIYDMAAKVFSGGGPHLGQATLPLFADMGTGKTPTVIKLLTGMRMALRKEYLWLPVLIVCPNAVKYNWLNEFRMWAPEVPESMLLVIVTEDRNNCATSRRSSHFMPLSIMTWCESIETSSKVKWSFWPLSAMRLMLSRTAGPNEPRRSRPSSPDFA